MTKGDRLFEMTKGDRVLEMTKGDRVLEMTGRVLFVISTKGTKCPCGEIFQYELLLIPGRFLHFAFGFGRNDSRRSVYVP